MSERSYHGATSRSLPIDNEFDLLFWQFVGVQFRHRGYRLLFALRQLTLDVGELGDQVFDLLDYLNLPVADSQQANIEVVLVFVDLKILIKLSN